MTFELFAKDKPFWNGGGKSVSRESVDMFSPHPFETGFKVSKQFYVRTSCTNSFCFEVYHISIFSCHDWVLKFADFVKWNSNIDPYCPSKVIVVIKFGIYLIHRFWSNSFGHLDSVKITILIYFLSLWSKSLASYDTTHHHYLSILLRSKKLEKIWTNFSSAQFSKVKKLFFGPKTHFGLLFKDTFGPEWQRQIFPFVLVMSRFSLTLEQQHPIMCVAAQSDAGPYATKKTHRADKFWVKVPARTEWNPACPVWRWPGSYWARRGTSELHLNV